MPHPELPSHNEHNERVKRLAVRLLSSMMERGEIEQTEEAIRAAMPQVVADARQIVTAAEEYVCG